MGPELRAAGNRSTKVRRPRRQRHTRHSATLLPLRFTGECYRMSIVGITRVRNEALIIADTLRHYADRCDRLLVYDDCSTDATPEIAADAGAVVIRGDEWRQDRRAEETRHRGLLLDAARDMGATWVYCFDADERLVGELPPLVGNGFTVRLFDGYLTADRQAPYTGGDLADLPRMWGPEYRDILTLFRVSASRYVGDGNRCPRTYGPIAESSALVQHYGKCLSVEHWEETCAYYSSPLWPERYRSKWEARKGKAIHERSDFGRPLYDWPDVVAHGVPI